MCLAKIDEVYDKPSMLVIDGWKEFVNLSGGGLKFDAYALNGSPEVPLDKWLRATTEHAKEITATSQQRYAPGFHVYADEKEMKGSNVRRVFVRNITCLGGQSGKKCYVAQEMYVPSNENGWPPKNPLPGSA